MLPLKNNINHFVLISILFLISCDQPATTSHENTGDTTSTAANPTASTMPAYDTTMDPLKIAGENGKLLKDSLGIKIYEVWVKPGELAALHSHPDHAMYIIEGGKAIVYSKDFPGGEKGIPMEFKTGDGWVMGPVTDSARNIGSTTIKMLEVDVHRPRE